MHRTRLGTISVALGMGLFVLGCGPGSDYDMDETDMADTVTSTGEVGMMPGMTRVADIMGNPGYYLGDTVTVEAEVEDVLSTFAFALDEDAPLAGGIDNDLLVFSPKAAQLADIDDQWLSSRVRVTGTVRQVTAVELERELDRDLDPAIEMKLETARPVLIAHSFQRIGTQ